MWNEPTEKQLSDIPKLYETDHISLKDKVIYMHFFIGGCDWYIAEYDAEDGLFFCFAILHSDFQNAEWGYILFDDLRNFRVKGMEIDREISWQPRRASDIDRIRQGMTGLS